MPMILRSEKIYRDAIQKNWPRNRWEAAITAVNKVLANLHHDRNVEFAAFCIVWIDLRGIGRHRKPMWVPVGTDKAVVTHRCFQIPETLHAAGRVDPCKSGKALGILLTHFVYIVVRNLEGPPHIEIATANRDQKRSFDTAVVHLQQVIFDRDAAAHVLGHSDFALEFLVDSHAAFFHDPGRIEVANYVDTAITHRLCTL